MPPEEGLPEVDQIKDQPGADQDNDQREEGPGRDQSLHNLTVIDQKTIRIKTGSWNVLSTS